MNVRLTAILLIVLVLLGGSVYAVQQNPATPTPAAKTTAVLSFLSTDVTQLETSGGGKVTVVARDGDQWALRQPAIGPADRIRLDSLVSRLSILNATKTIEAPGVLSEFGLDQPAATTTITLKDGKSYVLAVGGQSPDKGAYYARLADQPTVYLIPVATGGDILRLLSDPPKATPTPTPLAVTPFVPAPTAAETPSPEQ